MRVQFCNPDLRQPDFDYVLENVGAGSKIGPDGPLTEFLKEMLSEMYPDYRVVLTNSGTTALMVAMHMCSHQEFNIPDYCVNAIHTAAKAARKMTLPLDVTDKGHMRATPHRRVHIHHGGDVATNYGDDDSPSLRLQGGGSKVSIEDAAYAFGHAKAFKSDIVVTSFGPHKWLTSGQGGAIFFKRETSALMATSFINHGTGGGNYRLSDISAGLLIPQLERHYDTRLKVAVNYRALFGVKMTSLNVPLCHAVRADDGAKFMAFARSQGVDAQQPYEVPYEGHPWENCVYLPFGPGLSSECVDIMGEMLDKYEGEWVPVWT